MTMHEFDEILKKATAGVGSEFFYLEIADGDPVFRERVYCYELYHQMRKRWPVGSPYFLNGEIDKRAHPILRALGIDGKKPDFLIHTPGEMNNNYAIIEVKHSLKEKSEIRKDIETLSKFVHEVEYKRAIYLIFGRSATPDGADKIKAIVEERNDPVQIELWLHAVAGRSATLCTTFGLT